MRHGRRLLPRLQNLSDVVCYESLSAIRHLFDDKTVDINFQRAKETFRKIMLIKPDDNKRDKRMPHKHQIDVLKAIDPALCKTLRDKTVCDFHNVLYPFNPKEDLQGTVFCLDGTKDDQTIFEDLTKRAELLANEIKYHKERNGLKPVKCYLMDGFGRVFLCLIKALIDQGIDPDNDVEFIFCEIDDDVHEYHKYVFPSKVTKLKQNVLKGYGDYVEPNSLVYLNFCSIPSSADRKTWKMNLYPRCIKENVLKFISKITRPPKSCSVMVSLGIKDVITEGKEKLFPRIDKSPDSERYITGLGFLKVIRDADLFVSGDEDILLRPDGIISWKDHDTKRIPSAHGIRGKNVLVLASVMVHPGQLTKIFTEWSKDNKIRIDEITRGDMVEITSKKDNGKKALVVSRLTPRVAKVVLYDDKADLPKSKRLSSLRKLHEDDEAILREKSEIKRRLNFY